MSGKIIAGAALAVTGFGLYALTKKTNFNFTAPDLGAIANRTGQAASTALQGTLLFAVAALLTGCSAMIAINFVAQKIYPLKDGEIDKEAYKKLSNPKHLTNASILTLVGTVTGLVIGAPLMKAASSFGQFGSLYFVTSATVLALAGAGGGFIYANSLN